MITKTLGGNRLGSGNRMKQQMHDFYRSNKNLSTSFGSSMAAGVLYPCYTNIALKGDTFDIDLNAFVRTIPTIGPLYGSFKLQIDFFQVPFRLYQAILHNNTTDIARKMNQVYLPKVRLGAKVNYKEYEKGSFKEQINESALMRYLNQSGVGLPEIALSNIRQNAEVKRDVLAIPMLAYYDIFKNYYANQQEENAYVISAEVNSTLPLIGEVQLWWRATNDMFQSATGDEIEVEFTASNDTNLIKIFGENLQLTNIELTIENGTYKRRGTLQQLVNNRVIEVVLNTNSEIDIYCTIQKGSKLVFDGNVENRSTDIKLMPFKLSNIDDMRKYLLTQWDLGDEVVITENNQFYLPYSTITGTSGQRYRNTLPLNGLVVKTYQSDLFNNWLDTEWVNEITETSAIDVSKGSFTLDMLNFKKKLYDHLNRLAISGGTYDDWQEATYGDKVWGKSEKPIYCGGMSSEVIFDEVVSTAATEADALGTIAGRGTLRGRKGGHITIKVGEASVIMGIVSLTPRVAYSQGNAWYNTELKTMDDLHKPIFDRIGFQDLIVEQMCWQDAKISELNINPNGTGKVTRTSAGKQPGWMNYATDIDRVYGDFARKGSAAFMVLGRNYEVNKLGYVKDVTTYIDPSKFNYAFAYTDLEAQNFWTFINMKIHARRKMSNTQIPNV